MESKTLVTARLNSNDLSRIRILIPQQRQARVQAQANKVHRHTATLPSH